jgi:endo-1,4-beta-xylanase
MFSDDSLFYASSFGVKSPTLNPDWILVNGLAAASFNNSTDVVTGGGSLGSGMWKWLNLSQFTSQSGFTVTAGNLTQTFQIGARENGLDMDKFCSALRQTRSPWPISMPATRGRRPL